MPFLALVAVDKRMSDSTNAGFLGDFVPAEVYLQQEQELELLKAQVSGLQKRLDLRKRAQYAMGYGMSESKLEEILGSKD